MKIKNLLLILMTFACGHPQHRTDFRFINKYSEIEVIGESKDPRLKELSGLALSKANKGFFWAHNDSGDEPRVFLIDKNGAIHLTVNLTNAENIDWEDITIGEEEGRTLVFVGDIGDNRAQRENIQIYAFDEPVLKDQQSNVMNLNAQKRTYTYKQGPRDAETLFFDPIGNRLILVTKRDERVIVYPVEFGNGEGGILNSNISLPITQITGGDMSSNGEVLLKNYNEIYLIINRKSKSLYHFILHPEIVRVKYREEKQGEAICWDEKGEGFYVLSEWNDNEPQPFYYYHD